MFILNQSIAQSCDTSRVIVDKCKIRGSASVPGTMVKEQEVDPGGTPANQEVKSSNDSIHIRGGRGDSTYYYIDGIKVRGSANLPKTASEEVSIITGGLPINFGDLKGSIICVGKNPTQKNSIKTTDKEQNLATE